MAGRVALSIEALVEMNPRAPQNRPKNGAHPANAGRPAIQRVLLDVPSLKARQLFQFLRARFNLSAFHACGALEAEVDFFSHR